MCRSTYKSVLLYSGGAWNTCACDGVMASPYLVMGCTLYMADRVLLHRAFCIKVQCSPQTHVGDFQPVVNCAVLYYEQCLSCADLGRHAVGGGVEPGRAG